MNMPLFGDVTIADIWLCSRLRGLSAKNCGCRSPGGGWVECPPGARGIVTPAFAKACLAVLSDAQKPVGKRQVAESSGYSGDECDMCGSMRMRRTGVCLTCEDCGTSGGCG